MGLKNTFLVRIEPQGWELQAPSHASLLAAAEAAGIVLPSSCRNGTCRACICPMTAGEVRYEIPWPGLSREEKQEGLVLPCVAHATSDVTLTVPGAARF